MQEEVTFAGLAFVFMSYLLVKTPVLDKLIDLLNSVLGRLRGGPVFTATVAGGIFGAIAHVGAAVTAAVGSVTVPWMKRSGVRPEIAATIVAGGAGMGVSFPFSATMFILVGGLAAQGVMQPDEIILPLTFAGLWCLGYRLVLAYYLVRHDGIQPIAPEDRIPLARSLRSGWTSLLLFAPILIPLLLTRGPIAAALGDYSGVGEALKKPVKLADGTVLPAVAYAMPDVISLITWIPVLMIALVLFLGRRHLPHSPTAWWHTLGKAAPSLRRHRHHHHRRLLRLERPRRARPGGPARGRAGLARRPGMAHGHRHRCDHHLDRHPADRERHHGRRRTGRRGRTRRRRHSGPGRRRRRADLRVDRGRVAAVGCPHLRRVRASPGSTRSRPSSRCSSTTACPSSAWAS